MDHRGEREGERAGTRTRAMRLAAMLGLVACLVASGAGITYLVRMHLDAERERGYGSTDPVATTSESDPEGRVDNPVDFGELKEKNADIFAWLTIPGTDINAPVLQSATDDTYYLTHDRYGNESLYGALFTQLANSTDFSDPVTVIYGHDVDMDSDGVLFYNLHQFEDEEFFKGHEEMTIATPGHLLTYRIIAAYEYDDRHILNSFNFSDQAVLQEYYDSVLHPTSLRAWVREGATLDASKDKIVQMSTCMLDQYHGPNRYIVTGVLVNDQLTW